MMDTMMPIWSAAQCARGSSLGAGPAALAQARSLVRAAIWDVGVPVDPPAAALLTSELVANAIRHGKGKAVYVAVACPADSEWG